MTMFLVSSACFVAVGGSDLDLARRRDPARAGESRDLVLLEEEADAVGVGGDGSSLCFIIAARSSSAARRRCRAAPGVPGLLEHFGGMQQRLRGDAADVEAGAAKVFALFDDRDLEAELRGANGADIAAGAGADDDEIVRHFMILAILRHV